MTIEPTSPIQHSYISPFHSAGDEWPALAGIAQKIASNALELLSLDDCAVALLDNEGAHLVFLTGARASQENERSVFPLCQGPLAGLLERCEALILRDFHLNAQAQPLAADELCTLACLPLLARDHVLGWLLASSVEREAFPPPHMRALALLAEQMALATDNARQAELTRDAGRMKANFLSLVTHELRSPLNTINGYLDLLLEGIAGEMSEQQQEFIRRARSGSEHLYSLLEDLLLASRADAGQLRLNRTRVVLADLVDAAIEELEVTTLDCQVALESRLPAGLPALQVDPVRLQQVLRNLLINALLFTPAGGRATVSARVLPASEHAPGERLEVRVRDTGIGIAPAYQVRIFERFFQVPRPEGGRTSGQGLGLAIVKLIIELHGGQVRVESAPGSGSTFIFTLELSR